MFETMLWRNGRSVVDRIIFPVIGIGSTNDLDRKKEISRQKVFWLSPIRNALNPCKLTICFTVLSRENNMPVPLPMIDITNEGLILRTGLICDERSACPNHSTHRKPQNAVPGLQWRFTISDLLTDKGISYLIVINNAQDSAWKGGRDYLLNEIWSWPTKFNNTSWDTCIRVRCVPNALHSGILVSIIMAIRWIHVKI